MFTYIGLQDTASSIKVFNNDQMGFFFFLTHHQHVYIGCISLYYSVQKTLKDTIFPILPTSKLKQ